jgi:hypothetical protein
MNSLVCWCRPMVEADYRDRLPSVEPTPCGQKQPSRVPQSCRSASLFWGAGLCEPKYGD